MVKKLFTEGGFISEHGRECFGLLLKNDILSMFKTGDTIQEKQVIGSLLKKYISDLEFDEIQKLKDK
jgi:hypothetical protein